MTDICGADIFINCDGESNTENIKVNTRWSLIKFTEVSIYVYYVLITISFKIVNYYSKSKIVYSFF